MLLPKNTDFEMKVNFFSLLIVSFLLSGCAGSGRIVDGDGIAYSEYYENISFIQNPDLKIHAIETLGKERLPNEYQLSQDDKDYLRSPDTILSVFEVYITNNSESPISIQLGSYRSGGNFGDFEGENLVITPGSWTKSSPQVSVTSIYKAIKGTYELELTINEKVTKLVGEINRTPLDQPNR